MKGYRPPHFTFRFPYHIKTKGTGGYNAPTPGHLGRKKPAIKQFTPLNPKKRSK